MTGTGLGFLNANPNEYYITMDYHLDEMKEAFYRMVKMFDGLTECYRPGTFDKWKQSYIYLQELNPRFIYVWGGGFGYGPKVFGGSYDILGQAHAGLASVTGMHDFLNHAGQREGISETRLLAQIRGEGLGSLGEPMAVVIGRTVDGSDQVSDHRSHPAVIA